MLEKILNCTQLAGLIIIAGGTITLGALVAPIIFRELSRQEAGHTMIEVFSKFDKWILVASVLIFVAKLTSLIVIRNFNFTNASGSLDLVLVTSLVAAIGILLISVFHSLILSPQITEAYQHSSPNFEAMHHQSEALYKFNFLLGMVMLFCFGI